MATCIYFGVRTPNREMTTQCRSCKKLCLDEFRKCTKESNILLSTSIDVDKHGHTVEVPPTGLVSDTELVVEDFKVVTKESVKE